MAWAPAAAHWLHLMAAILWVGGTLFTSVVAQPALKGLPEEARLAFYREAGRRLAHVQWWTWGVLAATGLWKLWPLQQTPEVFAGPFGYILGVKLTLVAAMVALSLLHSQFWGPALISGACDAASRVALARRAAFWGRVNGVLMMAIVFCAVLLRFNPW